MGAASAHHQLNGLMMLKHHEPPTIDRKRERYLSSAMLPTDATSVRAIDDRKRYVRSIPQDERDAIATWWETNMDEVFATVEQDDTLDALVTDALAPMTGEREPWQRPVTLATIDGEAIDLVGVAYEIFTTLMGEPVEDRSEHANGAQGSYADKRTYAAEKGKLKRDGVRTVGDLTVQDGDTYVTHLAGETAYHLRAAYAANAQPAKREKDRTRKQLKREEKREALRKQRAEREDKANATAQGRKVDARYA